MSYDFTVCSSAMPEPVVDWPADLLRRGDHLDEARAAIAIPEIA